MQLPSNKLPKKTSKIWKPLTISTLCVSAQDKPDVVVHIGTSWYYLLGFEPMMTIIINQNTVSLKLSNCQNPPITKTHQITQIMNHQMTKISINQIIKKWNYLKILTKMCIMPDL